MATREYTTEVFILEKYRFGSELGSGSFGVVRKCVRRCTNENLAVKIIDKHRLNPSEIHSLQIECEIIAQIDHPNVVRTHEIFETDSKLYIIMERMSGGELFDSVIEKDHFSEQEAAATLRPIVDAINYCHLIGVVHRDLKPENLLFSSRGHGGIIKVSDFGLARFFDDEIMTTACGTPGYVAPEILSGRGYGMQCDFWSIGVVLYILLCGFPPFYEESNSVLFDQIKRGEFDFPSPYWDNISNLAKDLVRNLLQVDPEQRFGAQQVLSHPWFCGRAPNFFIPQIAAELRKYNAKRKFRRAAMSAVAVQRLMSFGRGRAQKQAANSDPPEDPS